MNKTIRDFAKNEIEKGLRKLTAEQQYIFRLMYGYHNPAYSIDEIVNSIHDEKLDWALTQIQNTLESKENVKI